MYGQMNQDMYGQQTAQDVYSKPPKMYGQSASSSYSKPAPDMYQTANTYGQQSSNMYGQQSANMYGQQSANMYGQQSSNMYGQQSSNMYGQQNSDIFEQGDSNMYGQQSSDIYGQPTTSDRKDNYDSSKMSRHFSEQMGGSDQKKDNRSKNRRSRRSNDGGDNQGRGRDSDRGVERELMEERSNKNKMAEELQIREQQLAMTSNLLEKQSKMLKNLEANMMVQSSMLNQRAGSGGSLMMRMDNQRYLGFGNMQKKFPRPRDDRNEGPPSKRLKSDSFGGRRDIEDKKDFKSRGVDFASRRPSKPDKQCNYCKKYGHIYKFCPDRLEGKPAVRFSDMSSEKKDSRSPRIDSKSQPRHLVKKDTPFKRGNTAPFGRKSGKKAMCRFCQVPIEDRNEHTKSPEHKKKYDFCNKGCPMCSKRRFNSISQYYVHQDLLLHKVMSGKKRGIVNNIIKPFSQTTATGEEYVVPVTGFFCKLCKKFYNKEGYAKDQHCKTRAHYDQVAAVVGENYETAIGAKLKEIRDGIVGDNVGNASQTDMAVIAAVKKANFVGLKALPPIKRADQKKDGDNGAGEKGTKADGSKKPEVTEEKTEITAKETEVTVTKEEETTNTVEVAAVTAPTDASGDDGVKVVVDPNDHESDHEDPELLEMQVVDEAEDENDEVGIDASEEPVVEDNGDANGVSALA